MTAEKRTYQQVGESPAAELQPCAVHKHSPTYGDEKCPFCGRFVPDPAKVLTAYHRALADAQGCTEWSCLYHGRANAVRRDLEHIQRLMGWTAEVRNAV